MTFSPLLAVSINPKFPIQYPVLGSPKFDGIRCVIIDGVPMTRSLKFPVKNDVICSALSNLPGLDGELMHGDPWAPEACALSQSLVMSKSNPELEPDWRYYVFDYADPAAKDDPFHHRLGRASNLVQTLVEEFPVLRGHLHVVEHILLPDEHALYKLEEEYISLGYEGMMIRSPDGRYKHGRSTAKEGILQKVKRWEDGEAIILEVYEEMENTNEATINPLGKSERSSHKENKIGKGTLGGYKLLTYRLGTLFGLSLYDCGGEPVEFYCAASANMKAADRDALWAIKEQLPNRVVTFKYQPTEGAERPRFPSFKCFRAQE